MRADKPETARKQNFLSRVKRRVKFADGAARLPRGEGIGTRLAEEMGFEPTIRLDSV